MPLADALRSGPVGSATKMCRDRRAVDVEHRGELSDRGAPPSLDDEIVHLRHVESRLPLTLRPNGVATLAGFGGVARTGLSCVGSSALALTYRTDDSPGAT